MERPISPCTIPFEPNQCRKQPGGRKWVGSWFCSLFCSLWSTLEALSSFLIGNRIGFKTGLDEINRMWDEKKVSSKKNKNKNIKNL